jgi:hypothetical protein
MEFSYGFPMASSSIAAMLATTEGLRGIGTAQEALLPFLQDDTLGLQDEGRRETSAPWLCHFHSFS